MSRIASADRRQVRALATAGQFLVAAGPKPGTLDMLGPLAVARPDRIGALLTLYRYTAKASAEATTANGLEMGGRRQAMRVDVGRGYQVLVHVFPAGRRRSSSLMPPHTPWSCLVSSANARHCCRTGQPAQIAFACVT